METIHGEFLFQLASVIAEHRSQVHPGDFFLRSQRDQEVIEWIDLCIAVLCPQILVCRKDTLEIDYCLRAVSFDGIEDFGNLVPNLFGCLSTGKVVGADHEEDFLGFSLGDLIEPFEHTPCGITVDAAICDPLYSGELAPFAAIGNAVSEKTYLSLGIGQRPELACPVMPVCSEGGEAVGLLLSFSNCG